MWPFRRRSDASPESFRVPEVRFFGEQDGPPERHLKELLRDLFHDRPSAERAYLAVVSFEEAAPQEVALCLRTKFGADPKLVREIDEVFGPIFAARVPLDIMFLTEEQEKDLAKVCRRFFEAVGPGGGVPPAF